MSKKTKQDELSFEPEEKRSALRVALQVFLKILVAAVIIFLLAFFLAPPIEEVIVRASGAAGGESTAEDEGYKPADWMLAVDGNLLLSQITLPGTHDSCTRFVQLASVSKCQAYSIGEQLELGYRYLDIRLDYEEQEDGSARLKLVHGITNCKTGFWPWTEKIYLEDVLEDCYAFLKEHDTETVVFVVKNENGADMESVQRTLDEVISQNEEMWLLTDEMPTLDEARGRIVLLRRYDDEAGLGERAGVYFVWETFSDPVLCIPAYLTGLAPDLKVQDRYCLNTEDKWTAFTDSLEVLKEEEGSEGTKVSRIHFLSTKGHGYVGHPYWYAAPLNARLMEYDFEEGYSYGWIIVDFGDEELARRIYSLNFN